MGRPRGNGSGHVISWGFPMRGGRYLVASTEIRISCIGARRIDNLFTIIQRAHEEDAGTLARTSCHIRDVSKPLEKRSSKVEYMTLNLCLQFHV